MRDAVVVINPVFNPDGHERYVVYYNSVALGSPEEVSFEHSVPWAAWGREAHPRLYALMQDFYGIDPAAWTAAPTE